MNDIAKVGVAYIACAALAAGTIAASSNAGRGDLSTSIVTKPSIGTIIALNPQPLPPRCLPPGCKPKVGGAKI
jgi:hypothetical protein